MSDALLFGILPYLAVGVLMEATIRTLKWHVKIRKALTHFGGYSIVAAALLGVASPLCACATLPLVISLLLAGLPLAPAMALLVTSPLMSPAAYSMLTAMLGIGWANTVLVCALLLGISAGYITHLLRLRGFDTEHLFRKQLPQGNFHDPDYPVEELRCECGQQLSHRVDRCTHNPFFTFWARVWEGSIKIGKFARAHPCTKPRAFAQVPAFLSLVIPSEIQRRVEPPDRVPHPPRSFPADAKCLGDLVDGHTEMPARPQHVGRC